MSYTRVTVQDLLNRLSSRYESIQFHTQADQLDALQESLRWWNLLTGTWQERKLVSTAASTTFPTGWLYTLPGTLTFAARITWRRQPLGLSSLAGFSRGRVRWWNEIAGAAGVPSRPTMWAPVGITRFVVWPGAAAAEDPFEIDGLAATPVLTPVLDGTKLSAWFDVAEEDLVHLIDEAAHILACRIGGSLWQATQPAHIEFLKAAVEKNSRLKALGPFRSILGLDRTRWTIPPRAELDQETLGRVTGAGAGPGAGG